MNFFALAGLSVGISCVLLSAVTVYFGRERLHHLLLLFNVMVAVWGFGCFFAGIAQTDAQAILAWKVASAGGIFIGPSFYLMVAHFCRKQRTAIIYGSFATAAVIIIVLFGTDYAINGIRLVYGIKYPEFSLLYGTAILFYLANVVLSYLELCLFLKEARGGVRLQTLYIIFAFSFGFAGGTFTLLPIFHLNVSYPVYNFGIVVYIFTLTFAIFRYRLMDLHLIFKKALVYSLSAGLLTGVFLILILGLASVFAAFLGESSYGVTLAAAIIIALLFDPLKQKIHAFLDKIFYRTKYDYYNAIQGLSRELALTTDLESTNQLIVDRVFSILNLHNACLLSETKGVYQHVYCRFSTPDASPPPDFSSRMGFSFSEQDSRMVRLLENTKSILVEEELDKIAPVEDIEAIRSELRTFMGEIVVPIIIDDKLSAVLILGEKLSGDFYAKEDINLLETIANQSAIAIRNARLYNELEERVEQRTEELSAANANLRESQEQIRRLAYHDSLTCLPNRVMFLDYFKRSLSRARREKRLLALLFIDLDNFKRINDTLGHKIGDLLLQQVARRMEDGLRDSDIVARLDPDHDSDMLARLGGDEFTIILPHIREQNDAAIVARRLLHSLTTPFMLEAHEVYVSFSIGITLFPLDADNAEALIKNADIAMYQAKAKGKNTYQYYSVSMNDAVLEWLTLEGDLRRALERQEFFLHYQPLVDCRTNKVVGLEALIRWQHPERGVVPPGQFIPIAEASGLIALIGEWVLWTVARQIRTWQDKGLPVVPVSVNLSSPQVQTKNIDKVISSVLSETGLDASCLRVELTENILIKADKEALNMLKSIKELGVKICLDDFGTGYSSLTYLKLFPIDVLKIDRSFVKNIVTDPKDAAISSAIIDLAKRLNLIVVAEGVEEREQLEFLREKGCHIIQGFYFFKPLPPQEIEKILAGGGGG